LGKLLGYDRIPEIKTLRQAIARLSENNQAQLWMGKLSHDWMHMNEELAGVLYADAHQEIYYGKKNKLPKKYVSRLQLAMRATSDYWICDKLGQPFFSISKSISSGLIDTIKEDILPILEKDVPNQPSQEELNADSFLHKFMLVYDREGYSVDFMTEMFEKRVSCCTYNKYIQEPWPIEEFTEQEVVNQYGEKEKIFLAERGVLMEGSKVDELGTQDKGPIVYRNITKENHQKTNTEQSIVPEKENPKKTTSKPVKKTRCIWVREVRKLRAGGNQTSIITTNYKLTTLLIGLYMFARWNQENYFKHMLKQFNLDMIISYFKEDISDTQLLVNPAYRNVNKQINSCNAKLKNRQSSFGKLHYDQELNDNAFNRVTDKKEKLTQEITYLQSQLNDLKAIRKTTPIKIEYAQLPEDEKFKAVHNGRKQLVDCIKIVAARSEIAMSSIVREYMSNPKDARALIGQFLKTNADLEVDNHANILYVKLHHQATVHEDLILRKLCERLNETKTVFPRTEMVLQYCLV